MYNQNIFIPIGTRPEAIRLYYTVKYLPGAMVTWTNQNYSSNLSTDILTDPRLKDVYENIHICEEFNMALYDIPEHIEKVLILGDTDSALFSAISAKKQGKQVFHMEAGNRCYDPSSPEEINRKMIDSISDVHMCYTEFAKQNLLSEGVPLNKIHVIGNPMSEFPEFFEHSETDEGYVLVTIHRAENEKYLETLKQLFRNLESKGLEVKLVLHPRYIEEFSEFTPQPSTNFSDFVELEKNAKLIITDSGTVCEEAALLRKPCLIIRKTTERPELLQAGQTVRGTVDNVEALERQCHYLLNIDEIYAEGLSDPTNKSGMWGLPSGYEYSRVSLKVATIIQGEGNYI